ncbi:hypothetical protein GGR58DRAFT_321445 [Xylaria digitata]|nr:hypothetical protein GGR58DRAFT_321445 [Xylaria digitata]
MRRQARFDICNSCSINGTTCERQRPCGACVERGTGCIDVDRHRTPTGVFPRGAGLGVETYPYLSTVYGGITGVNDPTFRWAQVYPQPDDFHIQYVRWLQGGPYPMPPGYPQPNNPPERPNHYLQILQLPVLPAAPSMSDSITVAGPSNSGPQPGDLNPVPALSTSITQQAPATPGPSNSNPQPGYLNPVPAPLTFTSQAPVTTRQLIVPDDVDMGELLELSLGMLTIHNVASEDGFQRPPSLGPTVRLFDISPVGIFDQSHPNPLSIPSLRTIAYRSTVDPSPNQESQCQEQKNDGTLCRRATHLVCEDFSHTHPQPVCGPCNNESRVQIEKAFSRFHLTLRAYACPDCAQQAATDPGKLQGKRFNVWGVPPDAFQSDLSLTPSQSRGSPLRLTGCDCGTKLFDTVLCRPHRVEHFLDVRAKVNAMLKGRTPPYCLGMLIVPWYCSD